MKFIPSYESIKCNSHKQKRLEMQNRFVKFLMVGVLNTAVGYGIFAGLLTINIHYSIAAALSTVLGVLFNFKTLGFFVFDSNDNKKIWRFILVYIIVYILNVCGISLFNKTGIDPAIGGAAMLLPCAFCAYVLQKKLVFKNE